MTSSIRRKKSNKNILGKPEILTISIVTFLSIILHTNICMYTRLGWSPC